MIVSKSLSFCWEKKIPKKTQSWEVVLKTFRPIPIVRQWHCVLCCKSPFRFLLANMMHKSWPVYDMQVPHTKIASYFWGEVQHEKSTNVFIYKHRFVYHTIQIKPKNVLALVDRNKFVVHKRVTYNQTQPSLQSWIWLTGCLHGVRVHGLLRRKRHLSSRKLE